MDEQAKVRAKFHVQSVTSYSYGGKKVELLAVHDQSTPENARFTKATPNGKLEMAIDNPAAAEQFTPGKFFYVDFTTAE